MAITAHLELRLVPDDLDRSYQVIHRVLVDTRAFDGCLGVEVLIDVEDPTHVVVSELWASLEHDAAYRRWRAGDGASDLGSVLASAPVLTKFTTAVSS